MTRDDPYSHLHWQDRDLLLSEQNERDLERRESRKNTAPPNAEHAQQFRCWCHDRPIGLREDVRGIDDVYCCSPNDVERYLKEVKYKEAG